MTFPITNIKGPVKKPHIRDVYDISEKNHFTSNTASLLEFF